MHNKRLRKEDEVAEFKRKTARDDKKNETNEKFVGEHNISKNDRGRKGYSKSNKIKLLSAKRLREGESRSLESIMDKSSRVSHFYFKVNLLL